MHKLTSIPLHLGCTPNAGISKFKFTPGKKYRLRLINTSADSTMKFTIDGHNFTVFANDFVPVQPYNTNVVTLAVGQRSDVVVEAVGKNGDAFWMRSEMGNFASGNGCSFSSGVSTQAVAAVYYDGVDTDSVPTTTTSLTDAQKKKCDGDDLSLVHSLCPVPLEDDFSVMTFDVGAMNNGTHNVMHVNGVSFRADMNVNLLENVIENNQTFAKEWNVYNLDTSKKAVRVVIRNNHVTHHPMHLHGMLDLSFITNIINAEIGHDVNVLASGTGEWDGVITNPDSTLRRDVQMLKGTTGGIRTYIVLQFNLDNPGIWPMHW
jgi:FtsP/CotA-like multicopper oxidase with cupredoxin domain